MSATRIRVTTEQIAKFEAALKQWDAFGRLKALEDGTDPIIANAQRAAMESQLEDLRKELAQLKATEEK